jgi:hypothetical protein
MGHYDGTTYNTNEHTSLSVNNVTVIGGCSLCLRKSRAAVNGRNVITSILPAYMTVRCSHGYLWYVEALQHPIASGSESWAVFSQNASGIPDGYSVYLIGASDGGLTMVNRINMRSWPTLYNASLDMARSRSHTLTGCPRAA